MELDFCAGSQRCHLIATRLHFIARLQWLADVRPMRRCAAYNCRTDVSDAYVRDLLDAM